MTVVYAYNPVRGPVFDRAISAIVESYDRAPRRIRLLYRYPLEHERVMRSGRFRLSSSLSSWRPTRAWRRGAAVTVYEVRNALHAGASGLLPFVEVSWPAFA